MVHATMTTTTTQPMMSVPATTLSSTNIMPSCPTLPTYIQPRPSPPASPVTRSASSSSSAQHERRVQNRIRFALFIKVLLKLIDDKKLIRDQTKSIVKSYVKKNKQTRTAGVMEEDMELPLRGLVGDDTWLCARHYTNLYFQQKSKRKSTFPPSPTLKSKNLPHSVSMSSTSTTPPSFSLSSETTSTTTVASVTAAITKDGAEAAVAASTTSQTAAALKPGEEPQEDQQQEQEPDMITSNSRCASNSSTSSNIISVSGGENDDASSSSSTIIQDVDFLKGYDEYNDYMLNSPSPSSNHRRLSFASRPLPDSLMTLLSLPPMKLIPSSTSTSNHDNSYMEEDGDHHEDNEGNDEDEMDGTSSQRSRSSSIESFYVDDIPGSDALDELPSVFQQQHHQDNSNENFPSWLTDEFLLVHPSAQQHKTKEE